MLANDLKLSISLCLSIITVNIQNFESLSPALSRNNSLRLKKDKDESANANARKLSTGTRQLKAHELTYFGVKSSPITINTTDTTNNSKMHLSTTPSSSNNSNSSCSIKTNNFITNTQSSKVIINHHQRPDLIMHHQQKLYEPSAPELSSSEKKLMIETLDSCIDETNNLEPLYENLYQNKQQQYDRKLDLARDEKILDELTRAADEIMNVSFNIIFIIYCIIFNLTEKEGNNGQSVACNLFLHFSFSFLFFKKCENLI